MPGCCLVSFHFLWAILSTSPVDILAVDTYGLFKNHFEALFGQFFKSIVLPPSHVALSIEDLMGHMHKMDHDLVPLVKCPTCRMTLDAMYLTDHYRQGLALSFAVFRLLYS